MDDAAPARVRNNGSGDPTMEAHPCTGAEGAAAIEEVLLDRYVMFEDELSMVIGERGGTPEFLDMEFVQEQIYASNLSRDEMGPAIQRAREEVMQRYRAEIEAPADATLRQRKASRPSAVHKAAVALSAAADDYDATASAALYREALDGIEPHLPRVAEPPGITTLTLRVSWPCDSTWRNFPRGAYVAGADDNILALYVGPYRPGLAGVPGFYLVYDAGANSVAVAPPLPPGAVTTFSHCCIGTGVAVLRRRDAGDGNGNYAIIELLPRQDPRSGCIANAGTLFTWRSSGPNAGRWVQTEERNTVGPDTTTC